MRSENKAIFFELAYLEGVHDFFDERLPDLDESLLDIFGSGCREVLDGQCWRILKKMPSKCDDLQYDPDHQRAQDGITDHPQQSHVEIVFSKSLFYHQKMFSKQTSVTNYSGLF